MTTTSKLLLIGLTFFLLSFETFHKYYVSVSEVDYNQEEQTIEISSRLFVDDLENLLKERYDERLVLDDSKSDYYINRYFQQKFKVEINQNIQVLNFIGSEIEEDLIYCYFEIKNVKEFHSIKITNEILFDLYMNQQNIIHLNAKDKKKSFLLVRENATGLLNF